jgi:hypothetical protein
MKKLKILVLILLLVLPFGCDEGGNARFITQINADGSCYREILSTADSTFIVGDTAKSNPFRIDLDSTWEVSWSYKTSESHKNWPLKSWTKDTAYKGGIKVKAIKKYNSVAEMASSFKFSKKDPWNDIKQTSVLDKKFRWFYTYYNYREVYPKLHLFDRIPLSKYITNEEAEFWFQGKQDYIKGMNGIEIKNKADDLEAKSNKWLYHNIIEDQYLLYIEYYDSISGDKVDKQKFVQYKDTVINKILDKLDEKSDFNLGNYLDQYFKTKEVFAGYEDMNHEFKEKGETFLGKYINYSGKKLEYNLLMPGKILFADNAVSHGDTLTYNLDTDRMLYSDYAIGATSRKANTWAFVVTGILALLAVGSLFVKRKG